MSPARRFMVSGVAEVALSMLAPFSFGLMIGAGAEARMGRWALVAACFVLQVAWTVAGIVHSHARKSLRGGP